MIPHRTQRKYQMGSVRKARSVRVHIVPQVVITKPMIDGALYEYLTLTNASLNYLASDRKRCRELQALGLFEYVSGNWRRTPLGEEVAKTGFLP